MNHYLNHKCVTRPQWVKGGAITHISHFMVKSRYSESIRNGFGVWHRSQHTHGWAHSMTDIHHGNLISELDYNHKSWCHLFIQCACCQICKIAGCACAGIAGNVSPPPGLAIPICITTRAWRTCRKACRDLTSVFFKSVAEKKFRQSAILHILWEAHLTMITVSLVALF